MIGSAEAKADIVLNGTGGLNVNGTFQPNQDFTIEFFADQPAIDTFADPTRGLFIGTTILTLADPALQVNQLEATNINALRQDQFPQGLFLANDSNPFNAGFVAIFPQAGVIADPNVLSPFSPVPQTVNFTGAGLVFQLEDGSTVQFNQVTALTLAAAPAASVPEPAATAMLIAGLSLLVVRRRKLPRPTSV